jgi:hypothetical protein
LNFPAAELEMLDQLARVSSDRLALPLGGNGSRLRKAKRTSMSRAISSNRSCYPRPVPSANQPPFVKKLRNSACNCSKIQTTEPLLSSRVGSLISVTRIGEQMRKMYLLSAVVAGSLLAGSAGAQAAGSCEAMLKDFDAQLSAKGIPTTDQRVSQERSSAQQACMTNNTTAAQSSLNRAAANIGLTWTGKASSGNTGATEAQGANSQAGQSGASASQNGLNGTQNGAGINGVQNSNNNGTQNSNSNASVTGSGNNQAAKNSNGTTNGGGTRTQSANASSGDQTNGSNGTGSNKSSGSQSGTQ